MCLETVKSKFAKKKTETCIMPACPDACCVDPDVKCDPGLVWD